MHAGESERLREQRWIDQCGRLTERYGTLCTLRQDGWGWVLAPCFCLERIYRFRDEKWHLCAYRTLDEQDMQQVLHAPPADLARYLWRERTLRILDPSLLEAPLTIR